jgi:hypothetical protein
MANLDMFFTEDGDIELGVRRVDAQGQVLYLHEDGTIDTVRGTDGKEIRDIALSRGQNTDKQVIMNRLKTDAPDWFHHTSMGGNMSDLIGEPNTRETGEKGVANIIAALTYRNFLHPTELNVKPVPISQEEILFVITVSRVREQAYRLPLVFNLTHGIISEYQTKS